MKGDWNKLTSVFMNTYKIDKRYIFVMCLVSVLRGMNASVGVLFTKYFYEGLEQQKSFEAIALIIALMVLYLIFYRGVSHWFFDVYRPIKVQTFQEKIHIELFEHTKKIEMSCYDDPEFYNSFIWAMKEADSRIVEVWDDLGNLICNIVAFIFTANIIASINMELMLFGLACGIVSMIVGNLISKIECKFAEQENLIEKKKDYYEKVISTPEYSKEIRVGSISSILIKDYIDNLKELEKTRIKCSKTKLKYELVSTFMSTAIKPIVYMVLIYQTIISKKLSLAAFAVAFSAFWCLWSFLEDIIEFSVKIAQHKMYMKKIGEFLKSPTEEFSCEAAEEFKSISLKNVSFHYKTGPDVLHDINLTINKGDKIAFVGLNGSGKSTLIKLITGLYTPTKGEIILNDENNAQGLKDKSSVVFQDFNVYSLALLENVSMRPYCEGDIDKAKKALNMVTFSLDKSSKPDRILTKEFSEQGLELSLGDKQKVALARMFFDDKPVFILDEPSASLDPNAEYALNQMISQYSKEKTLIFISHRLSTTRMAEKIYVLEKGVIVEEGSHNNLMKKNGIYAKMFNLQSKKYE